MALTEKTLPVPPPVAATVHIYRGLMDRGTTWRQRVDNPTNWAIVSCGTTVSFALSDDTHSHVVLLLVMLFGISFLAIEARRTRYYDLWSSWLRLLETEYLAPILQDNCVTAGDTWQELIVRDLGYPHFKATLWRMVQRRLRDHYMAIYLFLLLSWLLKLLQPIGETAACDTFVCHAAVGPVPGTVVLGLVSSKTPVLESLDSLQRRTEEAAGHIDLDRLAISPQCGFASSAAGNPLSEADERAKLRRVVEAARSIWR